eukprot:6463985-Amphidinium_carterae.2
MAPALDRRDSQLACEEVASYAASMASCKIYCSNLAEMLPNCVPCAKRDCRCRLIFSVLHMVHTHTSLRCGHKTCQCSTTKAAAK